MANPRFRVYLATGKGHTGILYRFIVYATTRSEAEMYVSRWLGRGVGTAVLECVDGEELTTKGTTFFSRFDGGTWVLDPVSLKFFQL